RLPVHERNVIVARADPALVIGVPDDAYAGRACIPAGQAAEAFDGGPLPAAQPPYERAMTSGGSTGLPKLIIATVPATYDPATASPLFLARRAVLVPGPLYHGAPFSSAFQGLFAGCKVVVMHRFDAARCLELIDEHSVERMMMVPTMLQRIWRLPESERACADLSSLEFILVGGAPCPAWLMRAWIDWLGPDVMHEAFGSSERAGGTFISGREWLEHPGSVGRASPGCQLRILDEEGNELPPGEMGEIYVLPDAGQGSTYRYVGAQSRATAEGWESVGDMGYVDEGGYLYLGDRRTDMIVSGGRNIYPAEVEAALDACDGVRSSAVIGLPDDDLGQRVHAIVDVKGDLRDEQALRVQLAAALVSYKHPRSFEFVDEPLRDDAGKVRRSALREARIAGNGESD
ncbi:MAG: AMP-binding protein, partial [Halioglobus sp.]|nr:AMP-binding protein [Halioglobus sp.]